jgi:uncharacterized membrane-anchored protein YhcB (DUF1043 family)
METILAVVGLLFTGFVLGILVGRNNSAKVEKIVTEFEEEVEKIKQKIEDFKKESD